MVAALNTVRPALQHLRESRGRIVVVNGITAAHPDRTMPQVSAARAALRSLAHSLANDLAPDGINVNLVNLGAINTGRQTARHQALAPDVPFSIWEQDEVARRGIAVGRFGVPDDVAPMIAFLLGRGARFIAGAEVDIAGGETA